LEAMARIVSALAKNPDNAAWLGFRARAEVLSNDAERAIATLTRALDQRPDDSELMADLGTAYALRAETADRIVDYAYAIECFSRALNARPESREVLFNRAVVYQRMFLLDQAIEEWHRYLSLDPKGGWSDEARCHLTELAKVKQVHKDALSKVSEDPET